MPRKVLIVEDDPGVRRALSRLLEAIGFQVSSAGTVGEALAALDGQDVAVIDLHLPDALGTVLLQKIRREQRCIRTAIWTSDPAGVESGGQHPRADAVFEKPGLDQLIAW